MRISMVLLPLLLLVLRIQSASANLATDDLWTLTFSDEFEDAATAVINGAKSDCFNRVPICMPKDGEVRECPEYKDQLKDLNKCNWNVYDYANYMGDDPVTSAAFQSFKPKEVSVKDGQLILSAHRSPWNLNELNCVANKMDPAFNHCAIDAGGLESQPFTAKGGSPGFQQLYGRFEVRAKLSNGPGTWPAHWLVAPYQPNEPLGWYPYTGEIDITEMWAWSADHITQSLHTGIRGQNIKQDVGMDRRGDFYSDFHIFGVEWDPDRIRYFVDDIETGTIYSTTPIISSIMDGVAKGERINDTPAAIPSDPFFWRLNTSITTGTNACPPFFSAEQCAHVLPDPNNFAPQFHEIDYVRVYSRCTDSSVKGCEHHPLQTAVDQYNNSAGNSASATLNAYPNQAKVGDIVTVEMYALQHCDRFEVAVASMGNGRLIPVRSNLGDGILIYKNSIGDHEDISAQFSTQGFAPGTYLLEAIFDGCGSGPNPSGKGHEVFKLSVL